MDGMTVGGASADEYSRVLKGKGADWKLAPIT
jgi:hypothetical protein